MNPPVVVKVHIRTVERHIRALKERGIIEFRGAPKTGGYFIRQKRSEKLYEQKK